MKKSIVLCALIASLGCGKASVKGALRPGSASQKTNGGLSLQTIKDANGDCMNIVNTVEGLKKANGGTDFIRVTTYDFELSDANAAYNAFKPIKDTDVNRAIKAKILFGKNSGLVHETTTQDNLEKLVFEGFSPFDVTKQTGCGFPRPKQQRNTARSNLPKTQLPEESLVPVVPGQIFIGTQPTGINMLESTANTLAFEDGVYTRQYIWTDIGLIVRLFSRYQPLNECGVNQQYIVRKSYLISLSSAQPTIPIMPGLLRLMNDFILKAPNLSPKSRGQANFKSVSQEAYDFAMKSGGKPIDCPTTAAK